MISVRKKHKLCTERTPMRPFATRIAADAMFFRPRPKSKGRLAQKNAYVKRSPKKQQKQKKRLKNEPSTSRYHGFRGNLHTNHGQIVVQLRN